MKIVMFCDKYLYRKLNMAFPKYSENDAVIGSLFSEDEFDNFHVLDKDFINLAFNSVDGIKDIYLLLIQKSWYSDPTCINICKYVKLLHPETNIVFFMDEPYASHLYFCDRIVKEQLGFLAYDTDELKTILMNGFNVSQDDYTLPKLSQSKIKILEKQYMNS